MYKLHVHYDSPELQDEKNLEFYGIFKGTILFLSDRTVTVFVETIIGKPVTYDVALDWDVLTLKRIIDEKEKRCLALSMPHILMSFST